MIKESGEYNIFNLFYNRLKTVTLYSTALSLHEEYIIKATNIIEEKLITSLLNEDNYLKKIDVPTFYRYINKVSQIRYKEEGDIIIQQLLYNTQDPAQINTIKRLISYKPNRNNLEQVVNDKSSSTYIKITRQCPHCSIPTTIKKTQSNISDHNSENNLNDNLDDYYAVCGYSGINFNWKGCGNDWCTKCCKRLCKSWNNSMLFNTRNRYHNSRCCKEHAKTSGLKYPDDYCMCKTKYVNR